MDWPLQSSSPQKPLWNHRPFQEFILERISGSHLVQPPTPCSRQDQLRSNFLWNISKEQNFLSNQPHYLLHLLTLMYTDEKSWASFLHLTLKYVGPAKAEAGDISHSRHKGVGLKALPHSDFELMKGIRRCFLCSPLCRKNSFISLFYGTQMEERLLP